MLSLVVKLALVALFIALLLVLHLKYRTPRPPLPPGPRGLPIIGNVLDLPTENEWLAFSKWGETWGDICSITLLGQPIIIINSAEAAIDMLDKKGSIYSERPVLQMAGELCGWKNTLVLLQYAGERFKTFRRSFHRLVGTRTSVEVFHPAQELETRRFLAQVLIKPSELSNHIRRTIGAATLRVTYGYEAKENHDPFIELADKATEQFSLASVPGGWIVDVLPWLRHVPDWVPGAGFKQTAKAWQSTLTAMAEQPYQFVKKQMAAGVAPQSCVSNLLESKLSAQEADDIKWIAASLYSGAADTTVSAIHAFFLAMVLHPDAAKKAQEEIDTVIGADRLPTFEDREHLPYVNALVKEVLRWNSVVPVSPPHLVSQDDIHEDYFIPKGSLVLANIWGMTHDPRRYRNPMKFDPERYIPSKGRVAEPDPYDVVFGFGRRICPGSRLADASIFITCAMSLAVFDISKAIRNGVEIVPTHENTSGTISRPKPFECSISPRSEKALSLITSDLE